MSSKDRGVSWAQVNDIEPPRPPWFEPPREPPANGLTNGDVRLRHAGRDESGRVEGARRRVLTEAGKSYQRDVHDANRKSALKRLNRLLDTIKPLFESYERVETVRNGLLDVDHLFSDVMESHGKYHMLLDDNNEQEISSKWMNDIDTMVFDFKRYTNEWLREFRMKQNVHQNNDPGVENLNITIQSDNSPVKRHRDPLEHRDLHRERSTARSLSRASSKRSCSNGRRRESRLTPRAFSNDRLDPLMHEGRKSRDSSRGSSVHSDFSAASSTRGKKRLSSPTKRRSRLRSNSEPYERCPSEHYSSRKPSASVGSKHNSSTSSKLSIFVEQKAKVAALKAEAKFLRESQRAERGEEWELEREIAKAEAIADVYAEEEGRVNECADRIDGERSRERKQSVKKADRSSEDVLSKLFQLQNAPTVDIDKYDGNPLEYFYFMATFKEAVEQKIAEPRGRLTRLIQCTTGEAKELIKNCIQEDPSTGYHHALSLLENQYGNPYFIARAYIGELRKWEQLKPGDSKAFRLFYSFLNKCKTCMSSGMYLKELNTPDILQVLQSKLPYNMQDKWNRIAVKMRRKSGTEANFDDFLKMVETEALVTNDPMYSREAMSNTKTGGTEKRGLKKDDLSNFLVDVKPNSGDGDNVSVTVKTVSCACCEKNHDLDDCPEYQKLDVKSRKSFVFKKRLCFGCYKSVSATHKAGTCTNKRECKICKKPHPTGLHVAEGEQAPEVVTNLATGFDGDVNPPTEGGNSVVTMCIVPVKLHHMADPQNEIVVYAMLDNCSEGTFVSHDIAQMLMAPVSTTTVTIKTLNGETTEKMEYIPTGNLRVSALHGFEGKLPQQICLPKTYLQQHLPIDTKNIPTQGKVEKWAHLKPIVKEIPGFNESIPIGLLVGGNCPQAMEPHKVIPSSDDGPYAFRTALGWCVAGPSSTGNHASSGATEEVACNIIAVRDATSDTLAKHHFVVQDQIKDNGISEALRQMYRTEFIENLKESKGLSAEDKKFLDIMERHAEKEGKHHKLPLPLRAEPVTLPNNIKMAEKRTEPLKRRFERDTKYHEDYKAFMDKLLSSGAAKEVAEETIVSESPEGPVWYIPHHGVRNKNKPDKIRVVFDCSAKFQGRSLNDELLPGPDLTNLLLGVLLRFRMEDVPVMADIEAMFYQVYVLEEHRRLLRFLWWPNGDYSKELKEYEMCVHVFGAVSSGSCANFALQKTAAENEAEFGREAADTLTSNFYVDDMLKSKTGSSEAVELTKSVISMCEAGGFNLTKFVSTDKLVLKSLPPSKLAPSLQDYGFSNGSSSLVERALGTLWCIESDELKLVVQLHDSPLTRKGMLKTVLTTYDPAGTSSPFLLTGKKVLQEIVHEKTSWEDEVSDQHRMRWEKWRSKLHLLESIRVPRCVKPVGFGESVDTTIHNFADASEIGYGEASYMRQVNEKGEICVSLLMGKSRVAPIAATTIPRLELTAAVVAAKVSCLITEELRITEESNEYWSDSQIVLGYISNEVKRFRIYVANRAQLIREITDVSKWNYVPTSLNPADYASRGLEVDAPELRFWFYGPDFLWLPREEWPPQQAISEIGEDDPEVRRALQVNTVSIEENLLARLELRISSFYRCIRVIATMKKFVRLCKRRVQKRKNKIPENDIELTPQLNVDDLQEAERCVIKMIQMKYFHTEIKLLKSMGMQEGRNGQKLRKAALKKSSSLRKLDPFLDANGIIRVGGRLRKSVLDDDVKHPIILPRKGKATMMIIRSVHSKIEHCGRNMTQNELRASGYWVVNGNSVVRAMISQCVRCRYLRGQAGEQKMADLPQERTCESSPFTHCGVDMFGPFTIKEGRKQLKRYVCLFTCLSSRAVHLETTNTMETDSFIQALRRFIARRGVIRSIRSDNGGNFVGADEEFRKALAEMSHEKIRGFLQGQGCDWIEWQRNPPKASHMGGVWERLIRSVRDILSSLMKTHGHILDDESLRTLLTEAESIVNSRPLTVDGLSDPDALNPLTPNHILTGKSKVSMGPPGVFQKEDIYCRKRWRRVQHITNEFWSRWRREFLLSLQKRVKWVDSKRNFAKGDIVILKDEDTRRNQWPMARVTEVFPDNNGDVRSVNVLTAAREGKPGSMLKRPIAKLVLLLETEEP